MQFDFTIDKLAWIKSQMEHREITTDRYVSMQVHSDRSLRHDLIGFNRNATGLM